MKDVIIKVGQHLVDNAEKIAKEFKHGDGMKIEIETWPPHKEPKLIIVRYDTGSED